MKIRNQDPGNYVVADGKIVVEKALESNLEILSILCSPAYLESNIKRLENTTAEILIASKDLLKSIVGYNLHQGVIAIVENPSTNSIENISGDVAILNGLTQPENIGSIVRTSIGFGIKNIIADETSCHPLIRRSIRVSMGSIFQANIYKEPIYDTIQLLKEKGYFITSLEVNENSTLLYNFKFPSKPMAIIVGHEGLGIKKEILDISDAVVQIPIQNNLSSLNASISYSIFAYQRSLKLI